MRHEEMDRERLEWGEMLPPHWVVRRLKHICEVFPSNVDKKTYDGDTPVLLCNYTDVYYNDRITGELRFMEATATAEQIQRFSLMAGDTIITKDSETADDIAIAAYVPEDLPGVVCGYHLAMVRPKKLTSGAFVKWLFGSRSIKSSVKVLANGLTRVGLGQYALDNLVVPVPPHAEQVAIATFLDRETSKIDALVEEQRRLIDLLREKRQAVISNVVTKGLDPNAHMKSSGVDWLGEVPEHWEVRSISSLSTKITNGYVGPTRDVLVDEGVRYLQSLHIKRNGITFDQPYFVTKAWSEAHAKSILAAGDVLIVQTGDIGQVAVVPPEFEGCNCHALIIVAPVREAVRGEWLSWVLNAPYGKHSLLSIQTGALHPHLNCGNVKDLMVPVPPINEQEKLVRQLESELASLTELADRAGDAMRLLQERRAALISAAVTGQIDLRETLSAPVAEAINVDRIRLLVAAEIVDRLSHKKSFGRVKLQKLLYLAEADAGIKELQGQYQREAAGPLDRTLIAEVDAGLQQDQHVTVIQSDGPGSQVVYHLRGQRGAYHEELVASIGGRAATLSDLVEKLGDLDTKSIEAVATLYAVWNDALLDHREPTDAMVVSGMLEDWHPEKARKFKAEELLIWLGWMRRNKLVPSGNGPRTTTGRLFT